MLVVIAKFNLPHEAHIARNKLASEGIQAFISGEHSVNLLNAFGNVELMVNEESLAPAKVILQRDDSDLLNSDEQWDG